MTLLDDEVLTQMFAELGESIDVPPSGAADALAALHAAAADGHPALLDLDAARARRRRRYAALAGVAAAILVVLGVGTSHSDGNSADHTASSSGVSAPAAGPAAVAGSAAAAGPAIAGLSPRGPEVIPSAAASAAAPVPAASATAAAASSAGAPSVDADRVIRTGDVNLQVPKGTVPQAVTELQGAATGLGGFLQDSQTQQADPKSGGLPSASVTLRVPAAQFVPLLTRVQALGTVVTSTTTGQDVTAHYVDLAARLKALETSRSTYLTILSQAKTVNDTLSVQQRLDDIQQQIEQLQGQQNALAAQTDLATLTVEVSQPAAKAVIKPKPPTQRSGLSQALHTAGDRFRRGAEAVIAALGTIALLLIAGLALLVAGRLGWRTYLRHCV